MEDGVNIDNIPDLWNIIEKEIITFDEEGKKQFNVPREETTNILDKPIIIWDWEIGITTSKSDNERDRYILLASLKEKPKNKFKLILSSNYILNILKKINETDVTEFCATIVRVSLKSGKFTYKFKD